MTASLGSGEFTLVVAERVVVSTAAAVAVTAELTVGDEEVNASSDRLKVTTGTRCVSVARLSKALVVAIAVLSVDESEVFTPTVEVGTVVVAMPDDCMSEGLLNRAITRVRNSERVVTVVAVATAALDRSLRNVDGE